MYHVLLAVDDDETRSLAQTRALTDHPGLDDMTVSVLYVFGENKIDGDASSVPAVAAVMEHLEDHGIDPTLYERNGNPSYVIVDVADELDVDMICVGGRKRSPAGKALFGSVAQSVILNTEKPVFITGSPSR